MKKNKLRKIASLFFLILVLTERVFACLACSRSIFRYAMPYIYYIATALVVWGILYKVLTAKLTKQPLRRIIESFLLHTLIIAFLFLGADVGAFFIYLGIAVIITSILAIEKLVKEKNKKLFYTKVILNISVALIVLLFVYIGNKQNSQMTEFECYMKYVHVGTGLGRSMSKKFAGDSDFDIEQLRPYLMKEGQEDCDKALAILDSRKNINDLIYFKDIVLSYELLENTLRNNYYEEEIFVYLGFWLWKLDIPKDIKTREELKQWIEEKERERERGN